MRRWSLEIYADHTDGSRREESLRALSGFAANRVAPHRRGSDSTAAALAGARFKISRESLRAGVGRMAAGLS
jgi:hypothetical protein